MDVSFESTDPRLAARIANAHIATYVEQNYRSKYESTTQASNWLADQLSELKVKVQKSEDARIAYERQNQIWTLDDKQNITTQRLSDINRQLTEAQSERMKKESLYQFAKSGNLDAVPQVQTNTALTELLKKRSDTSAEYANALTQYGPNFPKVLRLQAQLKENDENEGNRDFRGSALFQHSNHRPRHGSDLARSSRQNQEHYAGFSGRSRWGHRAGAVARVSRQHGEEP